MGHHTVRTICHKGECSFLQWIVSWCDVCCILLDYMELWSLTLLLKPACNVQQKYWLQRAENDSQKENDTSKYRSYQCLADTADRFCFSFPFPSVTWKCLESFPALYDDFTPVDELHPYICCPHCWKACWAVRHHTEVIILSQPVQLQLHWQNRDVQAVKSNVFFIWELKLQCIICCLYVCLKMKIMVEESEVYLVISSSPSYR